MLDITHHAPAGYSRSHQTEAHRTGGRIKSRLTATFCCIFSRFHRVWETFVKQKATLQDILCTMNWVGGARSRLRMKYEKKQQKDYFERKRYARQVKTVRPLSPGAAHRKGGISQDLLYLHTLNTAHSMDRKGCVSAPSSRQVNKVDLSKAGGSFPIRRQEDLELPNMSPDYSKTPSRIQLADSADSKPPCQHYQSYDDWLTSGKVGADTSDSEVHLFDQSARLRAAVANTSDREAQSHGTPFVPYTTPGPKALYKDPFRKFASSSSLVKFEEGPHTPDLRHDHDFDPEVAGIVNPPRTPGSSHKKRKLARIPSSGRSVRTPSTFSSSSQSSLGSPVGGDIKDKSHKEENHRPILLHQSAQSERPSLHNWLSSVSRDAEKSDTHPNNTTPSTTDQLLSLEKSNTHPDTTTPSTTDGDTLPAGKRRKLDFGEACSTNASQQRAAMTCSDNHAQPPVGRNLKFNTWDAVFREETRDKRFSIKPELPQTMKQNTDLTTEKTTSQKGYQATLQNLMSMPLTWANQQPTESRQKQEISAVVEEAFPAATQQFAPGSAPRTEEEFDTPTKEIAKRVCHEDRDAHQDEVSTPHIRDPFSPLSSQGSVCLSSGVESLSSLDLSEVSEVQELQTLEEALSDPPCTLMCVPKTAEEMTPNADTSGVEKDVSDCLQLLLTLVECGSFSRDVEDVKISPEAKTHDSPAACPTVTARQIPVQVGATEFVGSENTAVVESALCQSLDGPAKSPTTPLRCIPDQVGAAESVGSEDTLVVEAESCQVSTDEVPHFTEDEVLVKEVIDSIIRDAVDDEIPTEEEQDKTIHKEGTCEDVIATEQDDVKTDMSASPPPNESKQIERTLSDQQQQHKTVHEEETSEKQEIAEEHDDMKINESVSPLPNEPEEFKTEIREETTQKDQQTQTISKTEDTGIQTEASTTDCSKSETEMSIKDEQDTSGPLDKSSSRFDKSTQTPDQEGSVVGEESACEVDECELKARTVLDKVRGLPESCRGEKQLLTMLNDVEELIEKLESAHILQSLKEGTSA
ncbi:Hypp3004 [Branchiostoma lanceolatum]|uniref:Hypp3004 protein n=1 Tax=Branchiostoma lanceolatum TaxID=7740 RepID=A0A8K0ESL3_BRALA|nr:Hypp3004 [Branchiostoma lanceolatum]